MRIQVMKNNFIDALAKIQLFWYHYIPIHMKRLILPGYVFIINAPIGPTGFIRTEH